MKKIYGILMIIVALLFVLVGCGKDQDVKSIYQGTYSYETSASKSVVLDKNSITPSSGLGFEKLTGIVTKGGKSGKSTFGKYEWDYVYQGSTKIGLVANVNGNVGIGLGEMSSGAVALGLAFCLQSVKVDDIKFEHEFYGDKK